jgi:hypothetical protein
MTRNKGWYLLIGCLLIVVAVLFVKFAVFPSAAMSASVDVERGLQSGDLTVPDIATSEPLVHLPIVQADPTPTATSPPPSVLQNGGFEQGPVVWDQFSSHEWQLILHENNLPVEAHSGSWGAWLGGDYNETSILAQVIYISPGSAILRYWLWIASYDVCNPEYDIAGVLINDTAVDAFLLCEDENTYGWVTRSVNLSAYSGQWVTLYLAAFTDSTLNSNLLLDDVSLGSATLEEPTVADRTSPNAAAKDLALRAGVARADEAISSGDYRAAILELLTADANPIPRAQK